MSRKKWTCLGCGVDTGKIGEHYMLKNETWKHIHKSPIGMYCVGCAELKLGRQLTRNDFNDSYINSARYASRSAKLSKRLGLI